MKRKQRALLNIIPDSQGRCAYLIEKWNFNDSPTYECEDPLQTMNHITEKCLIHSYPEESSGIHKLENGTI